MVFLPRSRGVGAVNSYADAGRPPRSCATPGAIPDYSPPISPAYVGDRPTSAAAAFRLAAHGLHRSQGALGAFLRRMKSRLGAPAALTAAALNLARIVYLALKHGLPY